MALEATGLRFIAENVTAYIRDTLKASDASNKIADSVEKSTKKINAQAGDKKGLGALASLFKDIAEKAKGLSGDVTKALSEIGGSAGEFGGKIEGAIGKIGAFGDLLGTIPPQALAVAAGLAIATAAVAAFIALGVRGAGFQGIIDGFKQTGISLLDLREAANGTVSDIELMTTANRALAGATGQVRDEFADKLPKLLEIARAQARSTGQDVNFLFESLTGGIKRSSPLLIDNTGLVLKVGDANQAYALSIGKSVDQLSAQDKQIALLNATLQAGQAAIDANAGAQESNAEKLAQIGTRISNIFDRIAYAIQPVFAVVLDVVKGLIGAVESIVTALAPAIQFIAKIIQGVVSVIGGILGPILSTIGGVFQKIFDFILGTAKSFAEGGARVFGAFVTGVAFVLNRSLLPLIALAAQAIADFLVGQSPPPKGPLKDIDKGGRNVMLAWMDGFAGASMQAVQDASQFVANSMGDIASLSMTQVESRIRHLDKALQPFKDQLDIVKARFEAIQEPANAALDAIDRQTEKYIQSIADGDEQAAKILRSLDAQRASIENTLNFQQALVDQAQIQLSLAQSQQSEERSLLAIRQRQFDLSKKSVQSAVQATLAKPGATPTISRTADKAKTGGTADPTLSAGGMASSPIDPNQFGDNAAFIPDLNLSALGDIGTAFLEPLVGSGELELAQQNVDSIQASLKRMGDSDLAQKISGALSDIPRSIQDNLLTPISDAVTAVVDFFTDGSQEGTLPSEFKNFVTSIPSYFANLQLQMSTWFEQKFTTPIKNVVDFFINETKEGTLAYTIANIPTLIPSWLKTLQTQLSTWFEGTFGTAIANVVGFFINTQDPTTLAYTIINLPSKIGEWLANIATQINDSLVQPVISKAQELVTWLTDPNAEQGLAASFNHFFNGGADEEGTLPFILNKVLGLFINLPGQIGNALKSIGTFVWANFAVPIINIVNHVIGLIQTFLNALPATVNAIANEFGIGIHVSLFKIEKLDTTLPSFLEGAATGGLFTPGAVRVGERGPETIMSAERFAVLPNRLSSALDSFSQVFAQPQAQPVYNYAGGSGSSNQNNTYDQSFNPTMYGVKNDQDMLQRFRLMQALRRS